VLTGTTGPRGGFRLARPAAEISVLEIVEAVDGGTDPYLCREIRQQGRGALPAQECQEPCILATIMRRAHDAWRTSLASCTLDDIIGTLPPEIPERTRRLLARESA
jgi:Rrf2 family protein